MREEACQGGERIAASSRGLEARPVAPSLALSWTQRLNRHKCVQPPHSVLRAVRAGEAQEKRAFESGRDKRRATPRFQNSAFLAGECPLSVQGDSAV